MLTALSRRRFNTNNLKDKGKSLNFNLDDFQAEPKNTSSSVSFQVRKPSSHFVQQVSPLLTSHLYNWQYYARQGANQWVCHSWP